MEKLYDRADIYDLLENDSRYEITKGHWQYLLKGKPVRSLLDVSIGSGNMTLPVLDLGIDLYGSDLSIEHYNPVSQRPLLEELRAMGYTDVEIRLVPAQWGAYTDEDDWYCVMARKPKEREAL